MEIEKRKMEGGYILFTVRGDLTLKTGKGFVDPLVKEIALGQAKQVGVDISRAGHIDSFGIGCILKCHNAMNERRGIVGKAVFIMTEKQRRKLSVVGLDRILNVQIVPEPPKEEKPPETDTEQQQEAGQS
jgi:anti-anti-sigma regulatory factor